MHRSAALRNRWLFYVLPIAGLSVPPCSSLETPKTRGLADYPTPASAAQIPLKSQFSAILKNTIFRNK
jgi:hypothetical protein